MRPKYIRVVFYLSDIIDTKLDKIIGNGVEYVNDNYEPLFLTKKEIVKIQNAWRGYYD